MGSMSNEQFQTFLQCGQELPIQDRPPDDMHVHRCPVCDKKHLVNQVRHSFAYGKQLTCCCECEVQKRKLQRLVNRMHINY